ncbi:Heat shock transcription factor family [Phytophthora cactorum]|nr:Heat shock transcription factor family [Phytophthora cactorum]
MSMLWPPLGAMLHEWTVRSERERAGREFRACRSHAGAPDGVCLDKLPPVVMDATSVKPREVAPFLRSLRRMLENESDEILRWTPNGRAFEFSTWTYFKHRKYTSFQRQLNYFSFKKWTKSKAVVCTFSNDCFLRDRPDLAWRITRKKSMHTGGSTPRKSRPSPVATVPKPNVKLVEAGIAIRVPRVPSAMLLASQYGIGCPFPSPTDMDMMLLENDVEPQRYYQSSNSFASPSLSEQEVDSLEWIDNFLPSLEAAPRQDEPVFAGNTVNVSAGALKRQTSHYPFPSLQPPAGDYTCLTSM